MSQPSQLLTTATRYDGGQQAEAPEVLFEADQGIPFLWFLCFGTRNTYYPGVSIAEHGGAASVRDRFETLIEDAQYRIEHVIENLRPNKYLWPWLSPLLLLERRLKARPKTHYLYLATPAATARGDLRRAISFAENAVNYISAGNTLGSNPMLEALEDICPAVFFGDARDRERFAAARAYAGQQPAGARVALLMLGMPARDAETLLRQAADIVGPELAALEKLPPPPPPSAPEPEPMIVAPPPEAPPDRDASKGPPREKVSTKPYQSLAPTTPTPRKQESRGKTGTPPAPAKPAAPARAGILDKLLGMFRKS